MRWYLLVTVMMVFSCNLVLSADHPQYSTFSVPEDFFVDDSIRVTDTVIYKTGWYSVDGAAWQPFTLQGVKYATSDAWLSGTATASLPASLLELGEHYVIVYSCTDSSGLWDCHGGKWQLHLIDNEVSCGDVSCAAGEYCHENTCLLNVPGETYFVAPDGDDNNLGTFNQPWRTWGKAFNADVTKPGDIVYFRGGVYMKERNEGDYYLVAGDAALGYRIDNGGNATHLMRYFAYPGETPILDSRNIIPDKSLHIAIRGSAPYTHFKGLTIRNVHSVEEGYVTPEATTGDLVTGYVYEVRGGSVVHNGVTYAAGERFTASSQYFTGTGTVHYVRSVEAVGWRLGSEHMLIENCVVHDVHGVGFQLSLTDAQNITFLNTDAYNCNDIWAYPPQLPGNRGTGFGITNAQHIDNEVNYIGCRGWANGDQAFSGFSVGYMKYDTCWAWDNGRLQGGGHGFKLAYLAEINPKALLNKEVINSLAIDNRHSGFTTNDKNRDGDLSIVAYNNLAYHNKYQGGFVVYNSSSTPEEQRRRIFKNNLAYDNERHDFFLGTGAVYTHEHNSWDSPVTLDADDFLALPQTMAETYAVLGAPRKLDGSLPDLGDYFQLAEGSDLIDAGTVIPGYHCDTAGEHPGQECVEWYGNAPDIGPFESDYGAIESLDCPTGEYYFEEGNVCLLDVPGNTYFVAPEGNDTTGDGSFDNPWLTMQKAISMTHAGDISYFRGGVYYPTMYATHRAGLAYWKGYGYDGTADNPLRFFNYPGETPIFDNSNQGHLSGQRGLVIQDVDHAHYKGLTFRNVLPMPAAQCIGVLAMNSTNITFEQMTAHGFHGHGFFASSGSDDIYYLNCDSYNNNRGETTEAADGFNALLTDPSLSVYYKGCRSWGNSDDGFDMIYGGYAEFDNCWAFNIGPGDGNGFKIVTGLNQDVEPLMRKITNCISAGNKASGFHENSYTGIFNMHLYNSLAYKNGFAGFYVPTDGSVYPDNENIYRNNIAYGNAVHEAVALRGHWVHDHNSWDSPVVVSDEDFVLLPESMDELYSILSAPRQPDGSLPDLGDYFKLASDSDLIDAGVDVGLLYKGVAPDIGPLEYQG